MDLFPGISSSRDCSEHFGSRRYSFETLNPCDFLVSSDDANHSSDLDPSSGTSSSGCSPELPDYYGAYLSFIHDVLMEEEESDDTSAELPNHGALQATEKSFYDALSEPHRSLSDQSPSFDAQYDENSPNEELVSVDLKRSVFFNGQIEQFPYVFDVFDYYRASSENDLSGSVADSKVTSRLLNHSFNQGSSFSTNHGDQNFLVSERRVRKAHERDDYSEYQDFRSNKQLASFNGDDSEEIEQYEYILLRKDEKDDSSEKQQEQQTLQCEVDAKPVDDKKGKTRRGKTSRSKRQSGGEEVVDLRALLNFCAQAVSNFDIIGANELLNQIRGHSSPYGDSIQRVAHYFANGLEARMAGTGSQLYFNIVNSSTSPSGVLKCYQRYISAIPVNRISFFLANQMIAKMGENATQIHIIDFGIYHGFQWPSLIQQLSERPNGPPKLKITGIDYPVDGFRPAEKVEQTGRRLKVYCERFNVPFEYHAIAKVWETIKPEDIKIESGELVVVNSHYRSNTLLDETVEVNCPRDAFLRLIRQLNPDLFIHGIVNGSYTAPFFITRFREALLNFISVFDMMEATMPREDHERKLIEQDLHGKEILNIVANEGLERVVRPETYKLWQVRMQRAGFRKHPLNKRFVNRAKEIVKSNYHKDFVVDEDNHWMIQGWKGFYLSHVFREVNQVADRIAKLDFLRRGVECKDDLELLALIRKDALGWSYSRR